MRPYIISIDFDQTICLNPRGMPWATSTTNGVLNPFAGYAINKLFDEGNYIIIWTARYLQEDLEDVKHFLAKYQIKYHKINEPCDAIDYKSWPKVFCDTQIDDNCLLNIDWRFIPYYIALRKELAFGSHALRHLVLDEMAEFFFYRTTQHIKRVIGYCSKYIFANPQLVLTDILVIQQLALEHDNNKFSSPLLVPYIILTAKFKSKSDHLPWLPLSPDQYTLVDGLLDSAILAHYALSSHHPEKWDNNKQLHEMPRVNIIEMCADWCAMSGELNNDPLDFYHFNIKRQFSFSDEQDQFIIKTISTMWKE